MTHDILVIGAGPNGIYTFSRLKENFPSKKIGLIEKNDTANSLQQYPNINWHSPCNELELGNIKNTWSTTHPQTKEIISYYKKFFKLKKLSFIKDEVLTLHAAKDSVRAFGKQDNYQCKILILATGIWDNKNPITDKPLPPYASYCFPKLNLKNKHLVLVGGGNSAIDFIVSLLPNNRICWIIAGGAYTGSCANPQHFENFQNILKTYNANLSFYNNSSITEFDPNKRVTLSGGETITSIDSCHILTGYNGMSPLLRGAGAAFENKFPILNEFNETSLKNIYAVGSLSSKYDEQIYIHNGNPAVIDRMIAHINAKP